jgi:hypothetical protein
VKLSNKISVIAVSGAVAITSVLVVPPASATVAGCTYSTLFATDGDDLLKKYHVDGTSAGADVNLDNGYYDIAFDSSNGTFYGIQPDGTLDVVNVDTGHVVRSVSASAGFYNSLSVLPSGMVAASQNDKIVYINPHTGATTDYFDMNDITDDQGNTFTGWAAAGDFITMSDGSLIALLSNNDVPVDNAGTIVVRIADGAGTVLGSVPESYGGARVEDVLFLAGADGNLRKITSLPFVAGHGDIATTTVAAAGSYYGAAGTEDSEANTCSTSGRNGYTPGIDAYATTDPQTPGIAGELVGGDESSSNTDTLADTGLSTAALAAGAGALAALGAGLVLARRSRRFNG